MNLQFEIRKKNHPIQIFFQTGNQVVDEDTKEACGFEII